MIDFQGARLLAYERNSQYFGESYLYSIQEHLTIEGSIYNLTNNSGVAGVWQGIEGLVEGAVDYDNVVINGTSFGRGRINSLNFTVGNDVRVKQYAVDLTIFSQGDTSGAMSLLPNIYLAENFKETFEFSIAQDGTHSYKQSVSIRYIKGGVIADPIASAKSLAANLFTSPPAYGFIDNQATQFFTGAGKHTYTEAYNKITNECSFTDTFKQGELTNGVVQKLTQEISTGEDGISTITENGHFEDVTDFSGTVDTGSALSRANDLLSAYAPNATALSSTYVSLEKRINRFARTVDYSVKFTNDPRIVGNYSWEYTSDVSRGNGCYYDIKETGTIRGLANTCINTQNYANALTGWNVVKPGIAGRITSIYNSTTGLHNTLKLLSSNERKSIHVGQINYEYTYTDDLTLSNTDPIKKIEIQTTDNPPVQALKRFAVAAVGEVIQNIGIIKEAKRTVSLKMLGRRGVMMGTYLDKAKVTLNGLVPTGTDCFIESCNYSFTPTENTFNLDLTWVYFSATASGLTV